jgi:anti-anti-sigma factor
LEDVGTEVMNVEERLLTQNTTLTVSASLDSLGRISDFVVASAQAAGLDEHAVWEVQLAVDEAATNIILHAYGDRGMDGLITVRTEFTGHEFVINMRDTGTPFDPNNVPKPDLTSPLEERTTGGLGLYLMRKLMDRVEFHFDPAGYNLLTMSKRLDQSNIRTVRLSGRIDAAAVPSVQKAVREAMAAGAFKIVIDLADASFISSSGLRVLLLLVRELRKQGGDIRLCAARPQVAEVFHLTGFDRIFELYPSREAAAESFPPD